MSRSFWSPYISVLIFISSCASNKQDVSAGKTELDGLKVPAGYSIERIVDPKLLSFPMFGIFDNSGRMFVFESDGSTPSTEDMLKTPTYHVRLLQDTDNDGIYEKSNIFADSLTIPKGGVFYEGSLYVTATPDLLRITDTDGDGVGEKREVVHTGWRLDHNAAVLGGPFLGPEGWMYLTDARRGYDITNKEGVRYTGKGARIWRCRPDGSGLEPILGGGYDNAVELVFMPAGETIGTMTYFLDPQGGQRDAIMHWVEGGVYPKPHNVIAEDKMKLTGDLMPVMTKLARIAPAGLMRYRGTALSDEFNGNLFSAEFNTGRIMRSKIVEDGATFKTTDEPFVTATLSDVHPTDVFQDADGSMIVMNTGGWFIAGCPLSRVAKLDVPGGIYRVRKDGAPKVEDPWGKKIDFTKLPTNELANLVSDTRIFVSDNAANTLVKQKNESLQAVKQTLLSSKDEELRARAVFICGRIGTGEALAIVREALNDNSAIVKTAAARVLGLAKDKKSVEKLKQLVVEKNLAVRRQAAIALEQIGEVGAVEALLKAAAEKNDRYSEHAIIHALFTLKTPEPLENALGHSSDGVRRAALIALDQMDGYKIQKQSVVSFLESNNDELTRTGIWVTSHHKDWGSVVVDFLTNTRNQNSEANTLLVTFSADPLVQQYISRRLSDSTASFDTKKSLLDVITQSAVKRFPAAWTSLFSQLLKNGTAEIKSLVLSVVQSRSIKELNPQLQRIILGEYPAELKLKALSARLTSDPLLTAREFNVVMQLLDSSNSAPVRQQASRLLLSAELSSAQLSVLAGKIATIDNYLVANIVNSFEGSMNASAGEMLVSALLKSQDKLNNISEQDLTRVLKSFPSSVKKSAEPLVGVVKQKNAERLSQLQSLEASLKKGNISDGRKLFFGKAICSTCHAIAKEGNAFAPDLTNIGEIRSRHDILEAIMFPSASFAREYETSRVVTKTNSYNCIIREQYPDAIVIETGPGAVTRIDRKEIVSIEPGTLSLMPPGLEKQLTQQELSDLVAYLVSLPDGASGTIGF
ncbi:MAG: HEAT repeat domain-containing protein [Chitinophagaceae bacterium]|nr:HEAT repeat domain-containing protein [Chitinophagaceae bacterium]